MTGLPARSPGLIDRLRYWRTIRQARPVVEEGDVKGGREAEDLLARLVGSSFAFKDARLLTGRRVPSKRQGRRREIDLIICSPRAIHLIEVKNWSGRLDLRDHSWRQTRRTGEVVDHGDLLRENALRRDAVVEYLNDRGVAIDDRFAQAYLIPEIMFMNPRLELDPEVEARPDVFSRRELDGFLGGPTLGSAADRLFASLIDYFQASESRRQAVAEAMSPSTYEAIVGCLARTETWDRLHQFGSRVVTGDLLSLTVGGKTYRGPELATLSAGQPILIWWARNPLVGLVLALTGLGPLGTLRMGSTRKELTPEDSARFHAVGDREPKSVRLVDLERIELG